MIDPSPIPNWTRWTEKEHSGISRGYAAAFHNENRADHQILISEREYSHSDTSKITVLAKTTDRKEAVFKDKSPIRTKDSLRDRAANAACDWMGNHPCHRDGDARDGVELLTDILAACRDEGLVPQHDKEIVGFTRPGVNDSTTTNIRAFSLSEDEDSLEPVSDISEATHLKFGIGVDGKASGLQYRQSKDVDSDGEVRQMHDPINQASLHKVLKAAFETVGFEDIGVRNGGHQKYWDHAVSYWVTVEIPNGMELADPNDDVQEVTRNQTPIFPF